MLDRTMAVARKELRELWRDPVYLGLAFFIPMLMILLLGYGFSLDVKHLPVVFVDHDRTPYSREYMDAYVHSEYFTLQAVVGSARTAEAWLREGRARVIVDIPPDFGRRLSGGRPATVAVTVDGSFPSRAMVIQGYAEAINALYNQQLLSTWLARLGSSARPGPGVGMALSVWYNPALESKNTIVPGLLVLILMLFPALLGSLVVVRERESGTIFNLFASPVRRGEILAGKALPYVGVAMLNYLLLFAASLWLFHVRFIGSFWLLSLGTLVYAVDTVGIGLLISVLTRSQLAAMLVTFLATITPAFNYSGFMTPVASMDATGRFISRLIPATYFMGMVRGSYLKGLGWGSYWPDLLILVLYGVLIYALAWAFLRKRIG